MIAWKRWIRSIGRQNQQRRQSSSGPRFPAVERCEERLVLSAGTLDPSFVQPATDFGSTDDFAGAVAIQSDGNIVVAGVGSNSNVLIARYLPDGSLDPAFDVDGRVVAALAVPFGDVAEVAIQADGRILVAGTSFSGPIPRFALARFLTDGCLDTSFGVNGVVSPGFSHTAAPDAIPNSRLDDIALQADGRIVALGFAVPGLGELPGSASASVTRYRQNGALDLDFSTDGVVRFEPEVLARAKSIVVQPDGKLLVGGNASGQLKLARLQPDGSSDATFGVGGSASDNIGLSVEVEDVALRPDGRIVVVGFVGTLLGVAQYTATGMLDSSFNFDGHVVTGVNTSRSAHLAIDHAGRILVATTNAAQTVQTLIRYTADGFLDDQFGGDGFADGFAPVFDGSRYVVGMDIQADGRIVVAGNINLNGSTPDFSVNRVLGDPIIPHIVVTGTDVGDPPTVRVLDSVTGEEHRSFAAFAATFRGGVRVASGDFDGDGLPDVIVGMGGATGIPSRVRVLNGSTNFATLVYMVGLTGATGGFLPFGNTFAGGVNVAAGDVDGDGIDEIIVSPDSNSRPDVKIFKIVPPPTQIGTATAGLHAIIRAYTAAYRNGVRVASGDVNGDGRDDIITSRVKGTPNVRVFDGRTGRQLAGRIGSFNAFSREFRGGVYIAAGDINGDGRADIIASAGAGGSPTVRVFDGVSGLQLASFDAYDSTFRGGVRVAVGDVNGDGKLDLITSPGAGIIGATGVDSEIRFFDPRLIDEIDSFFVTDSTTRRGLFIGASR